MTRRENEDVDDAALEARLSWGIREAGGAERAPDVAAAVLARLASGEGVGADGANRMETPHARSRWLAAAMVLLGVSAVVGAFFAMRERHADDVQPARQEDRATPDQGEDDRGEEDDAASQDPAPITVVTDPAQIATLPVDLRAVELRNQDDAAVAALVARCPQLEHLRVFASTAYRKKGDPEEPVSITDAAFDSISRFDSLRRLELVGTDGVLGPGLRVLDRLPLLAELDLTYFDTDDDALQVLPRLPSLRALSLRLNAGFRERGMAAIARCPDLQCVDLIGCTPLRAEWIAALGGLGGLRELRLHGIGKVNRGFATAALGEKHRARWQAMMEETMRNEAGVRVASIAGWPRLTLLDLSNAHALEPEIGAVLRTKCPRLQKVDLSQSPLIDDSTIADLVKLDYLRSIDLSHCPQISRESFLRLLGAKRLRDIGLDGCVWLTIADVERAFAAGKSVRCVREDDPVWNAEVEQLERRYAEHLARQWWQVRTEQDLAAIPDDVTHVQLRGLGDAAVAQLVRRPNLLGFEFVRTQGGAPLTDAGLRTLAQATGLRDLELTGADDVTPAGLLQLRPLRELRTLHLSDTPLDDGSLQVLAAFPHLRELSLTAAPGLGDGAMPAIAACPTLRSLTLTSCKNVPAASLRDLQALTGLEELTLAGQPGVDDDTLAALRTATSLRKLELDGTATITSAGLLHLPVTLRELTLVSTPGLDGSAGKLLRDRFPELRALSVMNCAWVDDEALIAILDLPRLEHLDISVCKNTTAAVLPALRRAAPRLRRLDARMVNWLTPVAVAKLQAIHPGLRIDYKVW